jgi:hypothetical protein
MTMILGNLFFRYDVGSGIDSFLPETRSSAISHQTNILFLRFFFIQHETQFGLSQLSEKEKEAAARSSYRYERFLALLLEQQVAEERRTTTTWEPTTPDSNYETKPPWTWFVGI